MPKSKCTFISYIFPLLIIIHSFKWICTYCLGKKECLKLLRSFPAIFMVIDSSNANFLWNHIKISLASFHGNNEKEVHTKEWFGNHHKSNDTPLLMRGFAKWEGRDQYLMSSNSQRTHCNGYSEISSFMLMYECKMQFPNLLNSTKQ